MTLSLPITLVCESATPFTLTGESPAGGTFNGPEYLAEHLLLPLEHRN